MKNSFSLLEEEDNIRPLPNLAGKLEKGLKSGVEVEVLQKKKFFNLLIFRERLLCAFYWHDNVEIVFSIVTGFYYCCSLGPVKPKKDL